ncbi:MAG: phosphatase PAP2 family protein [Gammaproteobacteria bacterium]|nr:MAG: phosphatase PAP2 family protein [Gammaproteobacteria bacterium]
MQRPLLPVLLDEADRLESAWCHRASLWLSSPARRQFFVTVSRLGDGPFWYGLILLDAFLAPILAFQQMLAALVCTLLYKWLKHRTARERPFVTHPGIPCHTPPLDRFSFPSGHSLHAVCLTLLTGLYQPLALIILLPFAASVLVSRVVLGLHYPSDVAAGSMLGILIGWLVHLAV